MRSLLLLAVLSLAACGRPIAAHHADCSKFGFKPGTPDHARCVQMSVQAETDRINAGAARMGAMAIQPTPPVHVPSTMPVTCYRQGYYTYCQ